jgi:hypothetical protein
VCPKGQEEMLVTSMELFSLLLYSKYNLTADLSNVINAVDSIEIDTMIMMMIKQKMIFNYFEEND